MGDWGLGKAPFRGGSWLRVWGVSWLGVLFQFLAYFEGVCGWVAELVVGVWGALYQDEGFGLGEVGGVALAFVLVDVCSGDLSDV